MTKTKPMVAVVTGELQNLRLLLGFEGLLNDYHIEFFSIDSECLLNNYRSSIRVNVFENLKDMPGYMRTLEERLADFDIIFSVETSYLATFQSLRSALKKSKPCIVLVNEYHPYFYANYANIRAVQTDVFQNATQFWASSKLASSMLQMEGVPKDKIWMVPPLVDQKSFAPNQKLRKKFREYIKVADDDILVLFQDPLEPSHRPIEVMNAMRLLFATDPKLSKKVKLLYVGQGSAAKDLKYHCYDLALTDSIMFLHQNPEPFIRDLYAAADLMVRLRKEKNGRHEDYPLALLEAMASGVVPILTAGTVSSEISEGLTEPLVDETFQSLASVIGKYARNPAFLKEESQRVVAKVNEIFSANSIYETMRTALAQIAVANESIETARHDLDNAVTDVESVIAKGQNSEALVKIEDLFLRDIDSSRTRGELLRLKGDALTANGQLDLGMGAYMDCLKTDPSNYKAYRGLGYLAVRGHSHEDAMVFFKKALASNDQDEPSLLGVGLVHRRLGLNEEALFWLEKCVNINRSNHKAMTALIQTCLECTTTARPIATLQRIMDGVGDSSALTLTLGQLHIRDGNTVIGNELVSKAMKMQEEEKQKKSA